MAGLTLRPEARADLSEAARWYETQRKGLGTEFTRRCPYAVPFVLEPERVVVLACLHVRRSHGGWRSRQ